MESPEAALAVQAAADAWTWLDVLATSLATAAVLVVSVVGLVVQRVLHVPAENNPSKLYLDCFPLPRWPVRPPSAAPKVIVLTYGTRGDVQPLVVLGQELKKRGRCELLVCTTDNHKKFLESNGVHFVSCGVKHVEQPNSIFDRMQSTSFSDVVDVYAKVFPELSVGMWKACLAIQPDLIISQMVVRGIGSHICEKLGVPHWAIHFAPSTTPTTEFPPSEYTTSNIGTLNKLRYLFRSIRISKAAIKTGLSAADRDFRKNIVGFPAPLDVRDLVSDIEREPSLHAYSPFVVPKPHDWAEWHLVVGAMDFSDQTGETKELDSTLKTFLSRYPRPIYIGFGSMEGAAEHFNVALDCVLLQELSYPVVICTHLERPEVAKLVPQIDLDKLERVCIIKSAPHEVLFPRCGLVIHHGGAGTTNAALRAGVPQIIMPVLMWSDQPFWANVIQNHNIGFRCSVDQPAEFRKCVQLCIENEQIANNAATMGKLGHPNGAMVIADIIERYCTPSLH